MGTENIILLVLVVVVVAIGLWSTVRHFRGKGGGCCGGGDYKPRKKKLSHVAGQKTFQVEGMSKKPSTTSKARPARLT